MSSFALPLSRLEHPAEAIRQFTPNWFTVTMGTGITSLMLGQLSLSIPILTDAAFTLWCANILIFAAFSLVFVARFVRFPQTIRPLFLHPTQSMFVGAIPMGLATIVNGLVSFGPQHFGSAAYAFAEKLWYADVILSIASALIVPYLMWTVQEHSLERMTALWLLPIVPPEVAAASAGIIAPHVAHADQQILVVAGVMLWAFSVPAALAILTLLFLRLAIHKLPPKELGVSGWLTLGPLGTGALGLIVLGSAAKGALLGTELAPLATAAQAAGIIGGLILWSYGLWWWALSVAGTLAHAARELPFNMGWWAFTFPLGVYTAATYAIASALQAPAFLAIAQGLTVLLLILWAAVAVRTLVRSYRGDLFSAPCLHSTS